MYRCSGREATLAELGIRTQGWSIVFIPGIFGGFPPVVGFPRTAAKWRALNLESFFLGWENELQIYHGNFLLMDNKRRQLLVVKQRR